MLPKETEKFQEHKLNLKKKHVNVKIVFNLFLRLVKNLCSMLIFIVCSDHLKINYTL